MAGNKKDNDQLAREEKKNKEEKEKKQADDTQENQGLTQVKNAHASGLGSMGGYDEDLQNRPSSHSAEDY